MSTYIKAKKEKAMTDLSREILEKYQIRKSKAQKQKFRELILGEIDSLGYKVKVEKNGKAAKVRVYKMKPKKGYHRTQGHRQPYTRLTVESIQA